MTGPLGHVKHGQPVSSNVRNGTAGETVVTERSGPVEIDVPRDRSAT